MCDSVRQKNEPGVGYRKFFTPRVGKTSKNYHTRRRAFLPREQGFSFQGLILRALKINKNMLLFFREIVVVWLFTWSVNNGVCNGETWNGSLNIAEWHLEKTFWLLVPSFFLVLFFLFYLLWLLACCSSSGTLPTANVLSSSRTK